MRRGPLSRPWRAAVLLGVCGLVALLVIATDGDVLVLIGAVLGLALLQFGLPELVLRSARRGRK